MPISHPIPPVYDQNSKVLILGSFPSVKSRESAFFYGHAQNRFWKVLSIILNEPHPKTNEEKKKLLLKHKIALWDVIASCEVTGSADSSIQNALPNDLSPILKCCPDIVIFTNGTTAHRYYRRYMENTIHKAAICLPSTSAANAACTLPKLLETWQIITNHI